MNHTRVCIWNGFYQTSSYFMYKYIAENPQQIVNLPVKKFEHLLKKKNFKIDEKEISVYQILKQPEKHQDIVKHVFRETVEIPMFVSCGQKHEYIIISGIDVLCKSTIEDKKYVPCIIINNQEFLNKCIIGTIPSYITKYQMDKWYYDVFKDFDKKDISK